ncbi:MAG: hypothetical protein LBJ47_11815 [Tannerella sp.]|jgi:hypothetical protein|nr:hypothetical protein [Tannerella sp.]
MTTKKKKNRIVITLLCLFTTGVFAQEASRFNVYVTYKHSFGMLEKNVIWKMKQGLYGNALLFKGTYSINGLIALGAGFGTDVLESPHYSTFPVFVSVHVTPFKYKKLFFYNDLGYSLDTKISYPGLHEELGAGYKLMFKKHFGLSFNLGYNLKQMQNIIINDNGMTGTSYTTRHSLSAGMGFVF